MMAVIKVKAPRPPSPHGTPACVRRRARLRPLKVSVTNEAATGRLQREAAMPLFEPRSTAIAGRLRPVTRHPLEFNMLGEYQPLAHRASGRGDRISTLYCPGERPVRSRKTRERWELSTKPASSATRSSL